MSSLDYTCAIVNTLFCFVLSSETVEFVVHFWFFILFIRLVDKINNSIGQDPNSESLIGVLDIYGFESFKTNRCLAGMPFVFIIG